jgi:CheY-like chemotaxis protein/class 3 adenylate cyclase
LAFNRSKNKNGTSNHSIRPLDSNTKSNDQINFINYTQYYCVGIIDIINSTEETSKLTNPNKLRKYYSLFLNTMSSIISSCNGKIVKNVGDNLFYYFPKTSDETNESAFHDVFECGMRMFSSRAMLDRQLSQHALLPINYRVSMDYGKVEIAISANSKDVDLFGSVVNDCSKMSSMVPSNEVGVGKKLYDIVNKFQFIRNYNVNKINLQNDNKLSKNFGYFYSMSKSKENQREEAILNYSNEQKRTIQNHLARTLDNSLVNIMLIDDDEDILFTFNVILNRENYKVKIFSDSFDAFKHFTTKSPYFFDLIIMDIRMPRINGIQLYYKFKAINPYIKILLVSSLDLVQELVDSMPEINLNDIVKKPIQAEDFILKVKSKISY